MHFHRLFFSIIAIHQIGRAHSRIVHLNPLDGRDLETSLFAGTDDEPLFMADTGNKVKPCTGQEDHLSSSLLNSDTNLFTRDPNPEHEQCLPPVNIGADVLNLGQDPLLKLDLNSGQDPLSKLNLNLWKDPIPELERVLTKDKTPGGTGGTNGLGPGPEGPKVPPSFTPSDDEDDEERWEELFPIPDETGWADYKGPVWTKDGWSQGPFGWERRIDEEDDDNDPCDSLTTPTGFVWDLCCDGPPYVPTNPGTTWQYDAVEGCDWSKFFLDLFGQKVLFELDCTPEFSTDDIHANLFFLSQLHSLERYRRRSVWLSEGVSYLLSEFRKSSSQTFVFVRARMSQHTSEYILFL